MAITATIAGPIFNILIGLGAGQALAILNQWSLLERTSTPTPLTDIKVNFSLFTASHDLNPISILPLGLLLGQFFSLSCTLFLTIKSNYYITFYSTLISSGIYCTTVLALVLYTLYWAGLKLKLIKNVNWSWKICFNLIW